MPNKIDLIESHIRRFARWYRFYVYLYQHFPEWMVNIIYELAYPLFWLDWFRGTYNLR